MLVDALLAADPVLNISASIEDPAAYSHLTDSILREIERSKDPVPMVFNFNIARDWPHRKIFFVA